MVIINYLVFYNYRIRRKYLEHYHQPNLVCLFRCSDQLRRLWNLGMDNFGLLLDFMGSLKYQELWNV